jgi:hypothetical protein
VSGETAPRTLRASVANGTPDDRDSLKEAVARLCERARELSSLPEEIRAAPQRVTVRPARPDPQVPERQARRARAVAWQIAAVAASAGVGVLVVVFSRALG